MKDYLFGWRNYNIRQTDLVLEVGSGHHPLIRSDILCDKFPLSNYERSEHMPLTVDRPFVAADAIHLPFKDKSIDFIYCADVAEHLDQPHLFFDECMRVASHGAIITPSILAERIYGWDYHAVMYEKQSDRLIIHRKTNNNWGWFGDTFHKLWWVDRQFHEVCNRHPELFRMTYTWEERIHYEYAPVTEDESLWNRVGSDQKHVEAKPTLTGSALQYTRSMLSWLFRRIYLRRGKVNLKSLVCCPLCHRELVWNESQINCSSCGHIYPIHNRIPFLIPQ